MHCRPHVVPLAETCVVIGLFFGILGIETSLVLFCDVALRGMQPAVSLERILMQEWAEDRPRRPIDQPLILAEEHAEGKRTPDFLRRPVRDDLADRENVVDGDPLGQRSLPVSYGEDLRL